MFIGHFALGFTGKRAAPRVSLGWLVVACQWPDLLWPVLSLLGMEHFRIAKGDTAFTPIAFDYYPWSHSLLMVVIWGVALGILYLWRSGDRRAAMILGVLVVSHWVLDWITHRPDMPLTPSNDHRFGLGLWNNIPATVAVEVVIYAVGVWLYARTTEGVDRIGRWGLWVLVAFLLVVYATNLTSPPPPSTLAVSVTAFSLWLLVAAAEWIDRHRRIRAVAAQPS